MLDHVIKPVLRHFDGLAQGDRRPLELPIRRRPPTDWQTLAETYLGGWSSNDQIRVRLLVEAWTPQTKAPEIASDLKSLLKPFSLPEFSAKAADPQPTKPQPKGSGAVGPTDGGSGPELPPEKSDPASEKLLTDLLNRVDRWWAGGKFETPKEHQELVLTFLKRALPLDDIRSPAVPAQRRLREANRGSIRIEDSATQPAGATVSFNLPRSQDTYDLLVALTHMSVAGRGSWNFSQGERYKRMASRWLRKHQDAMLQALDPEGLSTREPIRQATKFLALAAMVERRAGLPADTPAALAHLTSTAVVTPPTVLSESLGRLYADLPERRRAIQSFLVDETSLPQGDRGGIVVIDPQVITEAITEARGDPMFVPLSSSYLASYWKARYQPMDGLRGWTSLPSAIAAERQAIGHLVSSIDQLLAGYGFAAGGDYAEFAIFLTDTGRLIDLLRTQFRWPAGEIEFFKREKLADRAASLTRVLVDAAAVASGSNDADVLVFDPKDLQTVVGIVIRCSELVDRARAHAEAKMAHLREEGDPDEVERQIAEELARVGGPPVEVEA